MSEKSKFLIQYYIIYFLKSFLFLKQYLVLVLSRNLTAVQVSFIVSIYSIISILIEIPTGVLSDFIGCKKALIYGISILILGYILIFFNKSFISFCIFYMCFGLYDTIFSGSKESLIYNNIKYHNMKKEFMKYKNISRIIALISLSIAAFISGNLVTKHINIVLFVDILILIMFVITVFFIDEHANENLKKLNKNYKKSIKNGFKFIIKHKTLRKFIIFEAIWFPILMITINYCSFFYKEISSVNMPSVSVMMFCQILCVAIIQIFTIGKLSKQNVYKNSLLFIFGAIFGLLSFYNYNGLFSYILNILYFFCIQTADTLFYPTIQGLMAAKSRSLIVSIMSFIESIVKLIFLYFLGYLSKMYNYKVGFSMLFIFYTIFTLIFYYFLINDKHLRKIQNRK